MEQVSAWIQMLLLPAAALVATIVVVFAWNKKKEIEKALQERLGENFAAFQSIVAFAVQSAEQAGVIGLIKNIGEEKKRYAIDYIEGQLKMYGFNIDLDVIAAAIEGAIANKWEELQSLPPTTTFVSANNILANNSPTITKVMAEKKG